MKKWYVIIAALLVFFMTSSTYAFADGLEPSSLASDSGSETEPSSLTESSEPVEVVSGDSTAENSKEISVSNNIQNPNGGSEPSNQGDDNEPPVASFTYTISDQEMYDYIFNSSASYDPDGYITYWEWHFNDGTERSYVPNPTHNFEDIAPSWVTVFLTVKDNGNPPLSHLMWEDIYIPEDPFGTISSDYVINEAGEQSSSTASSSNYQEDSNSFIQNIAKTMALSDGVSLITSRFLDICSPDGGVASLMVNYCDLYIYSENCYPQDPKMGDRVYFDCKVDNEYEAVEYPATEKIYIQVEIVDICKTYTFTQQYGGDHSFHEVFISWPQGAGVSDVRLGALPADEWIDIDGNDNWHRFEDIGSQSSTQSLSSMESSGISGQITTINTTTSSFSGGTVTRSTNYGVFIL
jgi:hypothetical protein